MSLLSELASVTRGQIARQVAETRGCHVRRVRLPDQLAACCLADFLLCQLLVCPLVTMCWRSVWMAGDWLVDRSVISHHLQTYITRRLDSIKETLFNVKNIYIS